MAKQKQTPSKSKAKKPANKGRRLSINRQLKQSSYKSFRVSKRIRHQRTKLPPAWKILWQSLIHLRRNWKLFGGILLVYAALTIILVRGFGVSSSLPQAKTLLKSVFHGTSGQLASGVTLYGILLGNSATASDASAAYQTMLVLVVSVILIWALRQSHAKIRVTIRDAFYKGVYPLIPFGLVIGVIALQLIPLLIANAMYNFVFGNGLTVTIIEKALWIILFFLLGLLSLYMMTSSVFALYIVTLPDMRPIKALRSARELVRFRRWMVMRKFIFLPIVLVIVAGVLVIPIILYATTAAEWFYFVLTVLALSIAHSYMYSLYRELIT